MKLKKFEDYLKIASLGLLALFVYFFLPSLQTLPFDIQGIDMKISPLFLKVIYTIAYEIIIIAIIIMIFNKKIIKDFKDIKINHKQYFSKYLKYWLISLLIMMVSNLIIFAVANNEIANNEQAIRDLFVISPIYVFFSAVIFAPIVEELVFRQGVRNIFTNKILFILVSGLVFGGLHVISSYEQITDLLYLIPYCTPGFIFAYILTKTDNIFVSMGLHFLHNGILISLQFMILLFS